MATMVLGIAGSATPAGPVGGFIGAAIGGAIDNFILFPRLFPKPPIQGPKLDDLQVQLASEGSPLKVVIGPRNRVSGTVTWKSKLIETKHTQQQGKGGGAGQQTLSYTYTVDMLTTIADTADIPINRITRVWADSKLIYNRIASDKYTAIRFRYGNEAAPSSLMEAYLGVGKVPLFKKSCSIEFEGLQLADYGNRVPSITAEVEQDPDLSVAAAIGLILKRGGFLTAEYDVTRLGFCFKGYNWAGPQSTATLLDPILISYGIAVQEGDDGQLIFFPLGTESEITVPDGDLGARQFGVGGDVPRLIRFQDTNDNQVPAEVNVKYVDVDFDLQAGTERARRIDRIGDHTVSMDLPLTLRRDEAQATAKRLLWTSEQERQKVHGTLPPSYIYLRENDVLKANAEGTSIRVLLSEVTMGNNYQVQVAGRLSYPEPYTQTGQAGTAGTSVSPYTAPATAGFIFDGPALIDDHTAKVGVYFGIATRNPDEVWRGAQMHVSSDGVTYAHRGSLTVESTLGRTLLGPSEGPIGIFDDTASIDVELFNGTLASVTDQQCLDGSNRCGIKSVSGDWEIIGFCTATPIGTHQYRLSKLLRGLRGTEYLTGQGAHSGAGAPFIFLSSDGSLGWWERTVAALGTRDYYKFPGLLGNLTDYPVSRLTVKGITERPFSPSHFQGTFGPDIVLYGADISASATDNSFNSTTAGRFKDIQVGQPIQTLGFSSGGNNSTFVVTAKPTQQKLMIGGTLTTEAAGSAVTMMRGGANDLCLSWQRRTKRFLGAFQVQSPPLTPDENPETYVLQFRYGGQGASVVREITLVGVTSYVYTADEMTADGTTNGVTVNVYQVSSDVGRSVPAIRTFIP